MTSLYLFDLKSYFHCHSTEKIIPQYLCAFPYFIHKDLLKFEQALPRTKFELGCLSQSVLKDNILTCNLHDVDQFYFTHYNREKIKCICYLLSDCNCLDDEDVA